MYPMTEEDRDIQARARAFVEEELIPHEVEAEMNRGRVPDEVRDRQRARLRELGLQAMNMPKELGGGGLTAFQQALVSEQIGRATNALGWVLATPAGWLPSVATPHQIETWVRPTIRGERHECYAITEEDAGSDTDAIAATAARDGDGYVLNGEKWHVTSFNHADH
ncbi:MAG: acyl-CoA dehydrogenase family protein, partial [Actinomycetota bacterium]